MYLFSLHSVYVFSNFGEEDTVLAKFLISNWGLTSKPIWLANATNKVEGNNKAHMQDIQCSAIGVNASNYESLK